jgi:hypothetical protein
LQAVHARLFISAAGNIVLYGFLRNRPFQVTRVFYPWQLTVATVDEATPEIKSLRASTVGGD